MVFQYKTSKNKTSNNIYKMPLVISGFNEVAYHKNSQEIWTLLFHCPCRHSTVMQSSSFSQWVYICVSVNALPFTYQNSVMSSSVTLGWAQKPSPLSHFSLPFSLSFPLLSNSIVAPLAYQNSTLSSTDDFWATHKLCISKPLAVSLSLPLPPRPLSFWKDRKRAV